MSHSEFVHLRIHSAYSLAEGAIRVGELAKLCARYDMPAVGVTDTSNMFGALELSLAVRGSGVQPITGCQVSVAAPRTDGGNGVAIAPDQLVLLVQNEVGYRNLLSLTSHAFLSTEPHEQPHVTLDDLCAHGDGLIALTGGPRGVVGRLLSDGQTAAAEELVQSLAGIFPGRLYIEIMRHGLEEEDRVEGDFIDLAY
ncbi:MAG: PHP domain-containing protein, partial [Pseudomonadota bacterium]